MATSWSLQDQRFWPSTNWIWSIRELGLDRLAKNIGQKWSKRPPKHHKRWLQPLDGPQRSLSRPIQIRIVLFRERIEQLEQRVRILFKPVSETESRSPTAISKGRPFSSNFKRPPSSAYINVMISWQACCHLPPVLLQCYPFTASPERLNALITYLH